MEREENEKKVYFFINGMDLNVSHYIYVPYTDSITVSVCGKLGGKGICDIFFYEFL